MGVREKSHSEEWPEDKRLRVMRESRGGFIRLFSVNQCRIPVSVDMQPIIDISHSRQLSALSGQKMPTLGGLLRCYV